MRVPEKNAPLIAVPQTMLGGAGKRPVNMGAPTFNLRATADSFRSRFDLQPLNHGINDLAQAIAAGSMDLMAKKAETDANNAFATLNSELTEYLHGENGAYSRKGINAVGVVKDVGAFIEKRKRRLTQEMNKATKQMFEPRAMQLHVSMQKTLATYEDSERSQALFESRKAAVIADVNLMKNNALDPRACEEALERIQRTALLVAQQKGFDETATREYVTTAVSGAVRERGLSLVNSGDVYPAYVMVMDERLNPDDRQALRGEIKGALLRQNKAIATQNPNWGTEYAQKGLARLGGGTTRGARNNNLLNLKISANEWEGKVPGGDGVFEVFETPEQGVRAGVLNILAQAKKGEPTVRSIITLWAPASDDNPTDAYIQNVSQAMGVSPDAKLDLKDPGSMLKMVRAMALQENGPDASYSDELLLAGINDALGIKKLPKAPADGGRAKLLMGMESLMDRADYLAIDAVATKSAKEHQERAQDSAVSIAFNGILSRVKTFPPEVQDMRAAEIIDTLPPGEMQSRVRKDWEAQKKIRDEAIESKDAAIAAAFMDGIRENSLNVPAATQQLPALKEMGMSDKGLETLRKRLEKGEFDKETEANKAGANDGYRMIDQGAITSPEQIDVLAYNSNLTKNQTDGLKNYLSMGGIPGAVSALWSKVDKVYKEMNPGSKGLDENSGFIGQFLKSADMERLNREGEAYIRRHTANLLNAGEETGGLIWNTDMTYAEAVTKGIGDKWLPDVSDDEEKRYASILRSMGNSYPNKTAWRQAVREYKKYNVMGIPRPKQTKGQGQ